MEKRLAEILARKQEIRSKLDANAADLNLEEIEKELRSLEAEEAELRKKMAIAQKLNDEPSLGSPMPKPAERNRHDDMYGTMEYRNAFFDYVRSGTPIPAEFRDATKTTDAGAVIPTTTLNRIIEKIESIGMILPLVTRTTYAVGLSIPTSTVKPVATWVAESGTSPVQKKAVGSVVFAANKLRCAVGVSINLQAQSITAFENALVNNISEAMVKALEQAIINGSGSGQPKGILSETTANTLQLAKIDYKTLTDAEGMLPAAYEAGSVWIMTKKTFMAFVSMTDAQGQPIARVNYGVNGMPERSLLGRRVVLCDYLKSFDAATTGEAFAFIFRMEDYILNTAYNIGLKQYEDHNTDDIVRKAIMLADGKVVDSNSLVVLKKK